MGIFQTLFNKGQTVKRDKLLSTTSMPPPPLQQPNSVIGFKPDNEDKENNKTTSTTHKRNRSNHSVKSLITRQPSIKSLSSSITHEKSTHLPRFQLLENNTHVHHLTLPAQNKITASINGIVNGIFANKRWTEKRVNLDELQNMQDTLNARLRRPKENLTLEQKWGLCQETIGKGTSGIVRIVHQQIDGSTERLYAVKELRKRTQESSTHYIQRLALEFNIATNMDHINIIRTLDILPISETSTSFCQVMEYSGGGDLFDIICNQSEGLEVAEANCFFKQLIHGVTYMHSMGVAHRDLKPENLLLTKEGCLKISDFGSAIYFEDHVVHGLAGSEPYMAPEEFIQDHYDPRLVDIWSCGIIYMSMRKSSYMWHIAKAGEDEDYDKYLKFRQILDEERENAHRSVMSSTSRDENSMTEDERVKERLKREASILKARETIRKRAKECRFDALEGIDIEAKRVVYRMLDPNPETRIRLNEIMGNVWFCKIHSCQ